MELELEHLQLRMEHVGAQKKMDIEVVAFIMSQIPAKYEVVISLGGLHYNMKIVDQLLWKSWDGHTKSKEHIYILLKTHLDILQGRVGLQ